MAVSVLTGVVTKADFLIGYNAVTNTCPSTARIPKMRNINSQLLTIVTGRD